jgi:hypothetical protein
VRKTNEKKWKGEGWKPRLQAAPLFILQNLHFAKECKLHHLLLRRRPRMPQNVRDIDRNCATRATALRSCFFAPLKSSTTHPIIQGLNRSSIQKGTDYSL